MRSLSLLPIAASFAFLSLVAGCGSPPDGKGEPGMAAQGLNVASEVEQVSPVVAHGAHTLPSVSSHHIPDPQTEPSPLPVTPPAACIQIFPCLSGHVFDSTPGVCTCVDAPPACVQVIQCLGAQHFDTTPGVCNCVD